MNATIISCLFATLGALMLSACEEDPDALTGRGARGENGAEPPDVADGETVPESLQCTEKPDGRAYSHFDGSNLAQQRHNENVGVNRARIKPYSVMAGEYTRVLGAAPPSLAGAAASFDDPPARWLEEASHSGVSLNAIFDISFEGCATYVGGQASLAAAPTAQSANAFCSSMMRKAWSRTASPEEVDGCVKLATEKLGTEPDAKRRWSYVCASILSSSHFLTF